MEKIINISSPTAFNPKANSISEKNILKSFGRPEDVVDDTNGDQYYEAYNIKYIIGDDGSFHEVMLMLAGGGPTIWLDTWSQDQNADPKYSSAYKNCECWNDRDIMTS